MRGLEFGFEKLALGIRIQKEKSIQSLEIAVNVFELGNRFDPLDRRRMRLGRQARAVVSK